MGNKMLARYAAERDEYAATVRGLQDAAAAEDRDLTEAEDGLISDAAERIRAIDARMAPLRALDDLIGAHNGEVGKIEKSVSDAPKGEPARLTVQPREVKYNTPGEFMADLVRSIDYKDSRSAQAGVHSRDAAERIATVLGRAAGDVAAGTHQTTSDLPGLMPTPIVGQVFNDMDGSRPLIDLLGALDLSGTPGSSFERPVMSVAADAGTGLQSAEKAEGFSGQISVTPVTFSKVTFLRWMNISFQTIDWTSPQAWNLILQGMAQIYAEDTERYAEKQLNDGVVAATEVATDDYAGWIGALYTAKVKAATAGGTKRASVLRIPDTIFTSVDMDSVLGEMIDVHLAANVNGIGSAGLRAFGGALLSTPRVMLPELPASTVLYGRKNAAEWYEQRKGFIQGLEPKVFGVEIANGGYGAGGLIDPTMFVALTGPRANSTAVTLGQRLIIGGKVFVVTTAGTTHTAAPTVTSTAVGATVTDGTAVLTRVS